VLIRERLDPQRLRRSVFKGDPQVGRDEGV